MALPEETTGAVCHRDSPLTTNDAHDLLVGDEEPISRLPYRPMGGSIFKYLNDDGPQDWRADKQGTTTRNPLVNFISRPRRVGHQKPS